MQDAKSIRIVKVQSFVLHIDHVLLLLCAMQDIESLHVVKATSDYTVLTCNLHASVKRVSNQGRAAPYTALERGLTFLRCGVLQTLRVMKLGDVHHYTNDLTIYRSFRKKFEKKFDMKSDDHIDVYLCNSIDHDRAKINVTMSQEHYLLACLETFVLADCNGLGVDKLISSRLTAQDQPEVTDSSAQELYRGIVGTLLYPASWPPPDRSFAVSELSRFVSNPGKQHLEVAKRGFRYFKKIITLGLVYRRDVVQPPVFVTAALKLK